jgi:hypothetical protein
MDGIKPIRIVIITLFFVFVLNFSYAEQSGEALENKIRDSIEMDRQTGKKMEKWEEERNDLLAQIRELKIRKRWILNQSKKYEQNAEKLKKKIERFEERKWENRMIAMELVPFLDDTSDRLKKFVEQDIPFHREERFLRLSNLRDNLNDPQKPLHKNTRMLFQALLIEAAYGKSMDGYETVIDTETGFQQVRVLRLGRVGLFYVSMDESKAGGWNPDTRKWEPLSPDLVHNLKRALEMTEKKRTPQLVKLPVGRVK